MSPGGPGPPYPRSDTVLPMANSAIHECTYRIRYMECDPRLRLSPVALFNLLQETAIRASSAVGRGPEPLLAEDLGWFLLRFRLKVESWPVLGQRIAVHTWSSGIDKILASREFEVTDKKGETLALATSRWVVIDLKRRRPVRVPAWIAEPYATDEKRLLRDEPLEEEPGTKPWRGELHPRESDLDSNRHAGSATYVAALFEAIPTEARGTKLRRLAIDFKKEGPAGTVWNLESGLVGTGLTESHAISGPESGSSPEAVPDASFHHRILAGGDLLALAASTWSPVKP